METGITQTTSSRIQSVDFVRGLVMVLMAIDHVRVYSGLPAGGPEAGIFFTRWVTHFCAPAFVFLSGTSAFLYGTKLNNPAALARYLITRGILLIVLELTLIRFCWTFYFNYAEFTLAGVIWMLGWCMILLALMIRLKPKTIGIIGVAIIFLQQLVGLVPQVVPETSREAFGYVWEFIYSSGLQGPPFITILYVLVPWIGVMAAGYGFGALLQLEEQKRRQYLIRIGVAATLTFLIAGTVRAFMVDDQAPFIFRLLNQNKYPASQLFLLMTLGPSILLMPFVEKAGSFISRAIITFGKVPFFYYLLHIPLIHLSAFVVQYITEGQVVPERYATAPYTWMDEQYRWSLPMLYVVFLADVVILYVACRWYELYKFNHPEQKWLKFL